MSDKKLIDYYDELFPGLRQEARRVCDADIAKVLFREERPSVENAFEREFAFMELVLRKGTTGDFCRLSDSVALSCEAFAASFVLASMAWLIETSARNYGDEILLEYRARANDVEDFLIDKYPAYSKVYEKILYSDDAPVFATDEGWSELRYKTLRNCGVIVGEIENDSARLMFNIL